MKKLNDQYKPLKKIWETENSFAEKQKRKNKKAKSAAKKMGLMR